MSKLRSCAVAVMLAVAAAGPLTFATSIATPATAEAGVISSIKGAAKKVSGAVQTAGKAVGTVAKRAGTGVGSNIKRAAVVVGKRAIKLPPVKGVGNAVKAIRQTF